MPVPVGRDLKLTQQQLEGWLATKLPQADSLELTELRAPEGTGFSNDTLLFEAHWQEGGERQEQGFVARIRPSGFPVFPFYNVGHQFQVMQQLAEHTEVPVPKVFWNESDASILGGEFYVMEQLQGVVPTDHPPYSLGGWMQEISEAERRAIWMNGLEALAHFHSIDTGKLDLDFLVWPHLGTTPIERHLCFYERYYNWALAGREQPIAAAALEWLKTNLPTEEPIGLSWGDSRISNILYRPGDYTPLALLDWEMVTLGNPEQDLAWWLFVDRALSEGLGVPRLAGLPSEEESLAHYEELTGRRVEHLRYYTIWAGFRFAVIMSRIAQQQVEYGTMERDVGLAFEKYNMVTRLLAKALEMPFPDDGMPNPQG